MFIFQTQQENFLHDGETGHFAAAAVFSVLIKVAWVKCNFVSALECRACVGG